MLGTLVSLAVARMINLESFIWDMPTGVIREIWIALASLADRAGHECRLENVWVRWHDNSEDANPLIPRIYSTPSSHVPPLYWKYGHVEYPTLSILPPLKSLSVLDIDEASYLEEMGVLIERSRDRLRELRIGMSLKAFQKSWIKPSVDNAIATQDTAARSSGNPPGWPRPGGVLGILLSQPQHSHETSHETQVNHAAEAQPSKPIAPDSIQTSSAEDQSKDPMMVENGSQGSQGYETANEESSEQAPEQQQGDKSQNYSSSNKHSRKPEPTNNDSSSEHNNRRLNLETLELERISLSIPVMLRVFDWCRLTTLTILRCENHDKLWKALCRQYSLSKTISSMSDKRRRHERTHVDYPLKIKNIHTDTVSPQLLLFIKEAIAPNTLESVFLQESPAHFSNVRIGKIFRHVIQKHRLSLKRFLLDGSERTNNGREVQSSYWQKWMATRGMLSYITSGRMPQLRELGIAVHSKEWHFLLQRLPNVPQLRVLYFPHISQLFQRDPKELALQILDIVTIRPEIGLMYVGIQNKCYEIAEGEHNPESDGLDDGYNSGPPVHHPGPVGTMDFNDPDGSFDEDEQDEEEFEDEEDHDDLTPSNWSASDVSSAGQVSDEDETMSGIADHRNVQFQLNETGFFDDTVSVFKARHATLHSGL